MAEHPPSDLTSEDWTPWIVGVCERLGVDPDLVDVPLIHRLTKQVAHRYERPMAPVAAHIVGIALGMAFASTPTLTATSRLTELAESVEAAAAGAMNPLGDGRLPTGELIPYEAYLDGILSEVEALRPVRVGTAVANGSHAAGLRTAEAVTAVWDTPRFTNSAMDGFAMSSADLLDDGDGIATLPVRGDIAAGATGEWTPGVAVRIMTGAPVPDGADTVVPVERTDHPVGHSPLPATVRVPAGWAADRNIRRRGSDVAAGAELMGAGTRLDGAALAALVGAGVLSVPVHPRVRVGVIVTGDGLMTMDEVSLAGGSLGAGKILNSNSILVAVTLADFGADVVFDEICTDDPGDFDTCLARAIQTGVDCIITTGGASVGAYDVARRVLGELGVQFCGVGMQPGKPQGFGICEGVVVCALPGNPGAVHASLHTIVRPLLACLAAEPVPEPVPMTVGEGWSGKAGVRQFVPVVFSGGAILPVIGGGVASPRARSLARADGLASVAPEVTDVAVDDDVPVIVTRPR